MNIANNKQGKAGEFQRKISQVENIFEEVLDNSKKKFDQTDGQLTQVMEFLESERKTKAALLDQRRSELAQRQKLLQERFDSVARNREDIVKRVQETLYEREEQLKADLEKEQEARQESIEVI